MPAIKAVVLCSNSDGSPEFFTCEVQATNDEIENGEHLDAAKQMAAEQGFEGPMIAFDRGDAAWKQFGSVLAWQ